MIKLNNIHINKINNQLYKNNSRVVFKGTEDSLEISDESKKLNKEFSKLKKRLDEKIKRCQNAIKEEGMFISCASNITLLVIQSIHRKNECETRLIELNKLKNELTLEKTRNYLDKKKTNPNTSFLYNPINTYSDKIAKLKKHPEVKKLEDIYSKFNESIKKLPVEDFFIIDSYETRSENPLYHFAKVIDLSLIKNQQSYVMFLQMSENPQNCEEFCKNYLANQVQ